MDALNNGVATVWHNQQQLEAEGRALQQNTQRFAKQTSQWLATCNAFSQALKELGDTENWAKSIEADMMFISAAMEQTRGSPGDASPSSSGAAAQDEQMGTSTVEQQQDGDRGSARRS